MDKTPNSPNTFQYKRLGKDKGFSTQMKAVSIAFRAAPKTMLQVAVETNIRRANICRYISEMRKNNTIFLIKKGICPISNCRAGFYSTNLIK